MNNENNNFNGQITNNNLNNQNMQSNNIPNQNIYQQPVNNQPINQHMNPTDYNPQPINHPIQGQGQQLNNNMNYNYNGMNGNFNNQYTPKNKGNIVYLIIIGLLVVIIIGLVIWLILSKNDRQGCKEVYENENNTSQIEQTENNNQTEDDSKFSYNGFEFKKLNGFEYFEEDDCLYIYNDEIYVSLNLVNAGLGYMDIEANEQSLQEIGYITNNAKMENYSGYNVITYELSYDSSNLIAFIAESPDENYSFAGVLRNKYNTINYNDVYDLVSIISDSEKTGNPTSFAKNISEIDIEELIKKEK